MSLNPIGGIPGPQGPAGPPGPPGSAAAGVLSYTFQLNDTFALNTTFPVDLPPGCEVTEMRVSLNYEVTGTQLEVALAPGESPPGPVAVLALNTAGGTGVAATGVPWTNTYNAGKIFDLVCTGPAVDGIGYMTVYFEYTPAE